jgi:hypothetical protein
MKSKSGRDYLVLWKYPEALRVNGQVMTGGVGKQSGGLTRGDRMFVVATQKNELFLLGGIQVQRVGKEWAEGASLGGAFRIIPLRGLKWRLRFEATSSPKLAKDSPIAMQVRARRRLSAESAKLLGDVLSKSMKRTQHNIRVQEGKTKLVTLSTRERNRTLRVLALTKRGTICEICGFDFTETYGEFARNCVEVHHLEALAGSNRNGVTTSLNDVIVVCPNCHRALHQFKDPSNWKAFRRTSGLSRKTGD